VGELLRSACPCVCLSARISRRKEEEGVERGWERVFCPPLLGCIRRLCFAATVGQGRVHVTLMEIIKTMTTTTMITNHHAVNTRCDRPCSATCSPVRERLHRVFTASDDERRRWHATLRRSNLWALAAPLISLTRIDLARNLTTPDFANILQVIWATK